MENQLVLRRADVTRQQDLGDLFQWILQTHGRLDGVFHCAGVLRDGLILGQATGSLGSGIGTQGQKETVQVYNGARKLNPGFFVLFSSVSAVSGQPWAVRVCCGQCLHGRLCRLEPGRAFPCPVRELAFVGAGRHAAGNGNLGSCHGHRPGLALFYQALSLTLPRISVMTPEMAKACFCTSPDPGIWRTATGGPKC